MFGSLGLPEILFILVLALLVFGPRRLPEIGRTIGRALGEFRRATHDLKRSIDTELTVDEVRGRDAARPAQAPPAPPAAPSGTIAGDAEPEDSEPPA